MGIEFALKALAVFVAGSSQAALWAWYFRMSEKRRAVMAANADALIIATGALIVLTYVHDWRLLLADLAGTWVGTYLAVKRK